MAHGIVKPRVRRLHEGKHERRCTQGCSLVYSAASATLSFPTASFSAITSAPLTDEAPQTECDDGAASEDKSSVGDGRAWSPNFPGVSPGAMQVGGSFCDHFGDEGSTGPDISRGRSRGFSVGEGMDERGMALASFFL